MPKVRPRASRTLATEVGCVAGMFIICIGSFPLAFALLWGGAHCQPAPQCMADVGSDFIVLLAWLLMGAGGVMLLVRAVTARLWGPIPARDASKHVRHRAELMALGIILAVGGVLYLIFPWVI